MHASRQLTVPFWSTSTMELHVAGIDSVHRLGEFALNAVTPEYFATLGTRILRGRGIAIQDAKNAPRAIVVSEAMAKTLWPGRDPIGQCVKVGADTLPCSYVVGVAENIKYQHLCDDAGLFYYVSEAQWHPEQGGLFIRTREQAARYAEPIRRRLQEVMPGASYVTVTPLREIFGEQTRSWQLGATMFLVFGGLALALAAIGLYSVMAYSVSQRTQELGVRAALGAQQRDLVRLVVTEGVTLGAAGIVIGVVIALAGGQWLGPLLFEESPHDPLVFGFVAVGIGATTAMFSVTNGVLLKPLPIEEQQRLVLIYMEAPRDKSLRPFAVRDLTALRERSRVFAGVAGVQYDGAFPYVMQDGDRAFSVMTSMVSGEFFRVLGVRPAAGRLIEPADAAAGAEPVVMISYGLWQREFGGDPRVVGRAIREGQDARTIVGVAPRGFVYPKGVEVWVPLHLTPEHVTGGHFQPFSIIGRLRAGATLEQAQGEATAFVRERETAYPRGQLLLGQRAVVEPFRDVLIGGLRDSVLILSGAVGLVLVIAGVNVASLLLIRGVTWQRELAVR